MTEGVLLSVVGGALGLWLARVGVQALVLAYPTSLPRTTRRRHRRARPALRARLSRLRPACSSGSRPSRRGRSRPRDRPQGGRRPRRQRAPPPRPSGARDGGSRAGDDARHQRRSAAPHGLQPHACRRGIRSIAPGHVLDDVAAGTSDRGGARAGVSTPARNACAPHRACRPRPPCRICR